VDARRSIPAVERLLGSAPFAELIARVPRTLVIDAIHHVQNAVRSGGTDAQQDASWYAERVGERVAQLMQPSLRPVLNATGVVLHTNLGRAPLAAAAREAVQRVASGYSNLE
jgi:L-seryl-tRNA(Ser) seleniumtransferase